MSRYKFNSDPSQYLPHNDSEFEPFCKRGLNFLQMNENSLLSKTDEQKDVVGHNKTAILGITESKFDSSISDQEVSRSDYSILRSNRKRYGGVIAFYVKVSLFFNRRNVFLNSI